MNTNTSLIISNPEILGGKPVIVGTRIAVSTILDLFAAGMTHKEILAEYPTLNQESVSAALSFASSQVNGQIIQPIQESDGSFSLPTV